MVAKAVSPHANGASNESLIREGASRRIPPPASQVVGFSQSPKEPLLEELWNSKP